MCFTPCELHDMRTQPLTRKAQHAFFMPIAEFCARNHLRNDHTCASLGSAFPEWTVRNTRHGREKNAVLKYHATYVQRLFEESHQEMPI
ncbi:hypothetical protein D3C86_2058910 [compost metagenome]